MIHLVNTPSLERFNSFAIYSHNTQPLRPNYLPRRMNREGHEFTRANPLSGMMRLQPLRHLLFREKFATRTDCPAETQSRSDGIH